MLVLLRQCASGSASLRIPGKFWPLGYSHGSRFWFNCSSIMPLPIDQRPKRDVLLDANGEPVARFLRRVKFKCWSLQCSNRGRKSKRYVCESICVAHGVVCAFCNGRMDVETISAQSVSDIGFLAADA